MYLGLCRIWCCRNHSSFSTGLCGSGGELRIFLCCVNSIVLICPPFSIKRSLCFGAITVLSCSYDGAIMFFIAIFDKFKREVFELVTSLRFHKELSLVGMPSTGKWTATCLVIPEFRLSFPQPCSQLDSSMQDDATLGLQELGERCRRCVS